LLKVSRMFSALALFESTLGRGWPPHHVSRVVIGGV
jgi:hypothetical protein